MTGRKFIPKPVELASHFLTRSLKSHHLEAGQVEWCCNFDSENLIVTDHDFSSTLAIGGVAVEKQNTSGDHEIAELHRFA